MHQLIDKKNKIIIYLLFLFILSTTCGKFVENQSSNSYKINQINIKGLSNTDNSKIYHELKKIFYQNILLINREELQEVINKFNIIEEYSVQKIYPSTINIYIKPTKFIAKLSSNNNLVGANGKLIEHKENSQKLPYIFGEYNSKDFLDFKKKIELTKFTFIKFRTLYFFPSNRWDILTYDNVLIKLPQDNITQSLNLAYKILNSNDFKDKDLIDLRVKNNLIIK